MFWVLDSGARLRATPAGGHDVDVCDGLRGEGVSVEPLDAVRDGGALRWCVRRCLGLRVQALGFRVKGLGFRV